MTIRKNLNTSIVLCAVTVVCAATMASRFYLMGRLGCWELFDVQGLLLMLVSWMLGPACIVVLAVKFIRLYVKQQEIEVAVACLLLAVASYLSCFILAYGMDREQLFLRGFSHRVTALTSPDDLRQLARVARPLIPDGYRLCDLDPQQAAKWKTLASNTVVGRFGRGITISVYSNCVSIGWREWFWGSWGIQIFNQKPQPSQNTQEVVKTISIADDINVDFYRH